MQRAGRTALVTWLVFDVAAAGALAEFHHFVTVKELRGQ